jgi:hypothetical protein
MSPWAIDELWLGKKNMSKAKLVNELIKAARAGIPVVLEAGPAIPFSTPDNVSVGRFHTADGGLSITRT